MACQFQSQARSFLFGEVRFIIYHSYNDYKFQSQARSFLFGESGCLARLRERPRSPFCEAHPMAWEKLGSIEWLQGVYRKNMHLARAWHARFLLWGGCEASCLA